MQKITQSLPLLPTSLLSAYEQFDVEQKAVFQSHYVNNQPSGDACKALGMTLEHYNQVRTTCLRAIRKLGSAQAA